MRDCGEARTQTRPHWTTPSVARPSRQGGKSRSGPGRGRGGGRPPFGPRTGLRRTGVGVTARSDLAIGGALGVGGGRREANAPPQEPEEGEMPGPCDAPPPRGILRGGTVLPRPVFVPAPVAAQVHHQVVTLPGPPEARGGRNGGRSGGRGRGRRISPRGIGRGGGAGEHGGGTGGRDARGRERKIFLDRTRSFRWLGTCSWRTRKTAWMAEDGNRPAAL